MGQQRHSAVDLDGFDFHHTQVLSDMHLLFPHLRLSLESLGAPRSVWVQQTMDRPEPGRIFFS